MSPSRDLTPGESGVLALIRNFEKAAEKRKLSVTLWASPEAAEIIPKVAHVLRANYDREQNRFALTLILTEYKRYVDFLADKVGFTQEIDGSIRTYDGLTIEEPDTH